MLYGIHKSLLFGIVFRCYSMLYSILFQLFSQFLIKCRKIIFIRENELHNLKNKSTAKLLHFPLQKSDQNLRACDDS